MSALYFTYAVHHALLSCFDPFVESQCYTQRLHDNMCFPARTYHVWIKVANINNEIALAVCTNDQCQHDCTAIDSSLDLCNTDARVANFRYKLADTDAGVCTANDKLENSNIALFDPSTWPWVAFLFVILIVCANLFKYIGKDRVTSFYHSAEHMFARTTQ